MDRIRKNKMLAVIILGSFFICITYAFIHRIHPVVDAKAYDQIGWNLAQGFGFREDASKSYEFDHAITRAGPGYEFFLAGIYKIFGHRYEPVWVLQAILHTLSAYLLYFIAYRVFREQREHISLIAAAFFAFWPDLIEISAMLMTETLYLFFIILVVYLFVRAYEKSENKTLAGTLGAATGLAILTRPPLLLFVPVFLFFYYQKKQYRSLIFYSFFLILTLLPWTVRNYLVYHQFMLTTMIGDYNLWLGNTIASNGGQYNLSYNLLNEFVDANGFFGLKEKASAEFWSFVIGHPLNFMKLCLLRFIRYFSLVRPMGFWFYQSGLPQLAFVASSFIWIIGLFVAGFSGMLTAIKKYKQTIVPYLVVLALTAPILLLPTAVQSRYRFQIYPFLALFAGYTIASKKLEKITLLFLVAITAIDALLNSAIILDRLRTLLG